MGRENTPCLSEVLRENMDDVIEFNACDKTDDIRGKKRIRKEDSGRLCSSRRKWGRV